MNDELRTLWALRELDERLVAMQATLVRFPTQRRAVEERLTADRGHLEALKKQLGDLQLRRRQMEKDIEALEAEERKYQSQLPLVKKNEEYTALLHEISGARKKRSDHETELLLVMEEEEGRAAEKPGLERTLVEQEAEADARLRALAEEEGAERQKMAAVEAEPRALRTDPQLAGRARRGSHPEGGLRGLLPRTAATGASGSTPRRPSARVRRLRAPSRLAPRARPVTPAV